MHNKRLQRFRDEISSAKLDGAFIYSDVNRNYLTGFTGNESYIVITDKEAIFITDSRYVEQAKNEVSEFEIREYKSNIIEYTAELLKSLGIKQLGFEDNHMTYKIYTEMEKSLKNCKLVKLNGIIETLRQVKDVNEIINMEKAASIADDCFSHIIKFIKPGMTEKTIGLELEFFMRSKGASALSFPSIIASGKRSSLPHGAASEKIVESGDILTLDFGCVYNGYCSDMTRTIIIEKASQKQKEIYNVVLEANKKALSYIKPGVTGEEIDNIARSYIVDNGYGDYFGHGLGHGVGMEIHELPHVSKKGKNPMQSGMVITDEPGIYIPDFGGVRIEDLVLVTDDGYRVLSKSTKDLIELV